MTTKNPSSGRWPFFFLFLLVLSALCSPRVLHALLNCSEENVTVKILDGVRYRASEQVSLDLEIIKKGESRQWLFIEGKRFNVQQPLAEALIQRLKIGQILLVDFLGSIDDLGSGKLSCNLRPETIRIVSDEGSLTSIPFSTWEPFFPYLPIFKLSFILFFWGVVWVLIRDPAPKAVLTRRV